MKHVVGKRTYDTEDSVWGVSSNWKDTNYSKEPFSVLCVDKDGEYFMFSGAIQKENGKLTYKKFELVPFYMVNEILRSWHVPKILYPMKESKRVKA